jgi:hypothetical protein
VKPVELGPSETVGDTIFTANSQWLVIPQRFYYVQACCATSWKDTAHDAGGHTEHESYDDSPRFNVKRPLSIDFSENKCADHRQSCPKPDSHTATQGGQH